MNDQNHFSKIFWFIVGITVFGCGMLLALIYVPIPVTNQRYADVILGFITGTLISVGINYLLGGTPALKKPETNVEQADTVNVDTK